MDSRDPGDIIKRIKSDSSLEIKGPRQAYGDGDGSYWDRWLQVEPPSKSSFSTAVVKPTSGFKRECPQYNVVAPATHITIHTELHFKLTEVDDPDDSGSDPDDDGIGPTSPKHSIIDGSSILVPDRKKYWGETGRKRLFETFADVHDKNRSFSKQFSLSQLALTGNSQQVEELPPRQQSAVQRVMGSKRLSLPKLVTASLPDSLADDEKLSETVRHKFIHYCQEANIKPIPLMIRKFQDGHPSTILNLAGKGIGDKYVIPLTISLRGLHYIQHIDLTNNRLTDPFLAILVKEIYAIDQVITLNLSKNFIGREASTQLLAYMDNSLSLTSISMSACKISDKIGVAIAYAIETSETLTEIDLSRNDLSVDSGKALGKALAFNVYLKKIHLSWNKIRLQGASAIGKCLQQNVSLKHMDISYNTLGESGGAEIGVSLKFNKTLEYLSLENNCLNSNAVVIIASALSYNESLKSLILDGNTLGPAGGRAIVESISQDASRTISIKRCSFDKMSNEMVFDASNCNGEWALDCAKAYQYTIATELLELANTPYGTSWTEVTYTEPKKAPRKLKLHKANPPGDDDPLALEHGELVDESGTPFEIPKEGILKINVVQRLMRPQMSQVLAQDKVDNLLRTLKDKNTTQEIKNSILNICSNDYVFTAQQVTGFLDIVKKDKHMKMRMIQNLVPRIADRHNTLDLIRDNFEGSEIKDIKKSMGAYLSLIDENMTGHYTLNLKSDKDLTLLKRLQQLNAMDMRRAKYRSNRQDTSQEADWSCYRNCTLSGTPMKLTYEWTPPPQGVIEVDYVSAVRPPENAKTITNQKLLNVVEKIQAELDKGRLIDGRFTRCHMIPEMAAVSPAKQTEASRTRRGSVVGSDSAIQIVEGQFFTDAALTEALALVRKYSNAYYYDAEHAVKIVTLFPHPMNSSSEDWLKFARVEAAISLFTRITNLEDFKDAIVPLLDVQSATCLYRRLGHLNVMNPMSPDGQYELDLSLREERVVAEMLVALAIAEPGENWEDENYNDIPGWELPVTWTKEVPRQHKLSLSYTSQGPGCKPDLEFRNTLKSRVFCYSTKFKV